jgi:predicted Zn finger-like uncharacterized protein
MIIVCQKCSSRLQVDELKIPSRPFTIRCPKCNNNVESTSTAAVDQSAIVVGGSPATGNPREHSKAAPLFELENGELSPAVAATPGTEKLVELLSGLMAQSSPTSYSPAPRPAWNPRKALVCVLEENRDAVARGLAENNYQVFVAQDTRQAVERMREDRLDVVILDPKFDPVEQGSAFVTREVSVLRPAQRRRLFFILLSPTTRTMDAHAAFLNNANAVVNVADIGELPKLVEHRLREFNELYQEFNTAMRVPAL